MEDIVVFYFFHNLDLDFDFDNLFFIHAYTHDIFISIWSDFSIWNNFFLQIFSISIFIFNVSLKIIYSNNNIIFDMNSKTYTIISLVLLISITKCFHNPGIVIQIPNNYTIPVIRPQLPQQIPSILLQNFQLTNIQLREVVYNWKFSTDRFVILLEYTMISFDWKYGHDSGIGTFVQQYSDLVIQCTFAIDKDSRFKIDVDGAKITNQDKRHSIKISLGGKVPQIIIVQVTNLILNHAKAAFRSAIKSAIVSVVQAFTRPLREDVKIWCKTQYENKQQCIYLNTTLVGKPTVYQNTQLIQVNAAVYKTGQKSSYLDPSDAMFKVNSTQLNIQMHDYLFTKIIDLYIQMSPINITINSTQISSVTDINSQTLSVLFPKMRDFDPRPVLLNINVQKVAIQFNTPPFLGFEAKGTLKVETQNHNAFQPYINRVNGTVIVKIQPVIVGDEIGARINNIKINNLQFNQTDIQSNLVKPVQITKHLSTLMQWAEGGINGDLNTKKQVLQFVTLRVNPKLSILTNSLNIQIVLASTNQTKQMFQI